MSASFVACSKGDDELTKEISLMESPGLYLWLWILIGNAVGIVILSGVGGSGARTGPYDRP